MDLTISGSVFFFVCVSAFLAGCCRHAAVAALILEAEARCEAVRLQCDLPYLG